MEGLRTCYLKYDPKPGSREHFYHFFWGFLLPSLYEILINRDVTCSPDKGEKFLIRSCGPVMDVKIHEAFSLFGIGYRITGSDTPDEEENVETILLPRWDYIHLYLDTPGFSEAVSRVKELLLERFRSINAKGASEEFDDRYLILKRSVQHEYYLRDGVAEIPSYGRGRRSLEGIEEAAALLTARGIPSVVYEPGVHTLAEQAKAFGNCRGVVGIRGAEFANVLWMKPRSRVIMINTIDGSSPVKTLSRLLNLDFTEINRREENNQRPHLDAEYIFHLIASDG